MDPVNYVTIAAQALVAGAAFGGIVILIGCVIGFVIDKIGGE